MPLRIPRRGQRLPASNMNHNVTLLRFFQMWTRSRSGSVNCAPSRPSFFPFVLVRVCREENCKSAMARRLPSTMCSFRQPPGGVGASWLGHFDDVDWREAPTSYFESRPIPTTPTTATTTKKKKQQQQQQQQQPKRDLVRETVR